MQCSLIDHGATQERIAVLFKRDGQSMQFPADLIGSGLAELWAYPAKHGFRD